MHSHTIRQRFLDFFKLRDHTFVPSAPIVNKEDPELLFINAGMNPFKQVFLGHAAPDYPRVVNSQPCLRVSGKHNDLEEVGMDTYHHTFFEMLGNWSFGNYFKAEAIAWAWQLLTKEYGLPKERLYATFFAGDRTQELAPDKEAQALWSAFLPPHQLVEGDKKDNFWEMGATGPCGPCTELHLDLRSEAERQATPGHLLVNQDHPQVVEIWNVVFIQYNRKADGTLPPLPATHVDTGMGLERLAMALQGKQTTYDTDLFAPLLTQVSQLAGVTYQQDPKQDVALRVIADHVRAITFPIADGLMPSNQAAGYVLRRILRRAVRYGYTHLGLRNPFLHTLIPTLATQMAEPYSALQRQQDLLQRVVAQEEDAFLHTLDAGLRRLTILTKPLHATPHQDTLNGKAAFELYDTYGFPHDLTALLLREEGLKLDEEGFAQAMRLQKARSKRASTLTADDWQVVHSTTTGVLPFVGYDTLEVNTLVHKYRKVVQQGKVAYQLVLVQTPFYAQAGGQVGDTGFLQWGKEHLAVHDTRKEHHLIIHYVEALPANPATPLLAVVDSTRRHAIARHHSATHLLQAALRKILGNHVDQKGSLVHDTLLRFDFIHPQPVTLEEQHAIEHLVNQHILANHSCNVTLTTLEEAQAQGVRALFGEKYGHQVRLVTFGQSYAAELCGGTHVAHTGQIGCFKIVHEEAVGTGIRRLVAHTGTAALAWVQAQQSLLVTLRTHMQAHDLGKAIPKLLEEHKHTKKALAHAQHHRQAQLLQDLATKICDQADTPSHVGLVADATPHLLKQLAIALTQQRNCVVVLATMAARKPHLVVSVSKALTARHNAHAMVQILAPKLGGRGGGQPFLAMAGGKEGTEPTAALAAARTLLGLSSNSH